MDLVLDLDDDLLAAVERAARRAGLTTEEYVRGAIRRYVGLDEIPPAVADGPEL